MASIESFIAINDRAKWPNLTNSAFSKAKTSVTTQTNTGHLLNPKKKRREKKKRNIEKRHLVPNQWKKRINW